MKVNIIFRICLIIICILMITGCAKSQEIVLDIAAEDQTSEIEEDKVTEDLLNESDTLYVYVCGEVEKSGVYEVPAGTRMFEVISMAGGMTEDAALEYLNQAEKVSDGQKIEVPSKEILLRIKADAADEHGEGTDSTLININEAVESVLTTLPGIGISKAKSIVSYREKNGKFSDVEEIKNVEGIKDGLYHKVKDLITVK